jgi:copper(I)-binding protein
MIHTNKRSAVGGFLILSLFLSAAMAGPAIVVEAPWIREAPPASTVLAAYMVLKNPGDTPLTITSISSPDFKDADIHNTQVKDGVAKMLPVEELQLPAGGSLTFEPGSLHLMLFDPLRPLRNGDSVVLVIHYGRGDSMSVNVPVVRKTGGGHDHSQHH